MRQKRTSNVFDNRHCTAANGNIFQKIHWLPINHKIDFKVSTTEYILSSTNRLPGVLVEYAPIRQLNTFFEPLQSPSTRTVVARRAFSQAAPQKVWNDLPIDNRHSRHLSKHLKLEKVKALFIYIADLKASAYSYRFFCSAWFQLRSTTTGTLLLIRRPRRVFGRVVCICTQGRN